MIEHITRWIYASISKHFDARKDNLHLFIEGQERSSAVTRQSGLELRIDGPNIVELQRGYYKCYVEINVLVTTYLDRVNFHTHLRNIGIAQGMFSRCINIYKYGDQTIDDDSYVGGLESVNHPYGTRKDWLQVANFGQVDAKVRMQQASVEGHYLMYIRM